MRSGLVPGAMLAVACPRIHQPQVVVRPALGSEWSAPVQMMYGLVGCQYGAQFTPSLSVSAVSFLPSMPIAWICRKPSFLRSLRKTTHLPSGEMNGPPS